MVSGKSVKYENVKNMPPTAPKTPIPKRAARKYPTAEGFKNPGCIIDNCTLRIDLGSDEDKRTPVALDELGSKVASIVPEKPKTPVLVKGAKTAPYGDVMGLMSTLHGAGVPNVGLISEPPIEG